MVTCAKWERNSSKLLRISLFSETYITLKLVIIQNSEGKRDPDVVFIVSI